MVDSFQISSYLDCIPFGTALYRGVVDLHREAFESDLTVLVEELSYRKDVLLLVAHDDDRVLGYKLGHRFEPRVYFSLTGAVTESARRQGIAKALMERQHAWCQEQGYLAVRTETKNEHRAMLLFNIADGFDVIGTFTNHRSQTQIILLKKF